jgi:large subunit ribosomal protein L19
MFVVTHLKVMFVVLILCMIKQQVPENKRRESTLKGIVIGRRNAGINTTFRLRRLVAGVCVESVFPL